MSDATEIIKKWLGNLLGDDPQIYGEVADDLNDVLTDTGLAIVPVKPTEANLVAVGKIISRLVIEPSRLAKYGVPVQIYKEIIKAMIGERK